jgi:hexosaminidase
MRRKGRQKKIDNVPVSGYYKREDIKEILAYAEERFIDIIPEIDLPGHTRAVLASYPELSCTGGPFEVSTHWGVHKDVLCIGKEEVFKFAKDVLDEVIELFPAKMIHVGGDEVPTNRWKKCPDCQALINKKKFNKEQELQVFFYK